MVPPAFTFVSETGTGWSCFLNLHQPPNDNETATDPDFAAVVELNDYHVFLTPYGGHHDLSVMEQTPTGFRVEAKDATSAGRFSWRVRAKRKDIVGERLAKITIPAEPQLPTEPPMRETPEPPVVRSRMVRQ